MRARTLPVRSMVYPFMLGPAAACLGAASGMDLRANEGSVAFAAALAERVAVKEEGLSAGALKDAAGEKMAARTRKVVRILLRCSVGGLRRDFDAASPRDTEGI